MIYNEISKTFIEEPYDAPDLAEQWLKENDPLYPKQKNISPASNVKRTDYKYLTNSQLRRRKKREVQWEFLIDKVSI